MKRWWRFRPVFCNNDSRPVKFIQKLQHVPMHAGTHKHAHGDYNIEVCSKQ